MKRNGFDRFLLVWALVGAFAGLYQGVFLAMVEAGIAWNPLAMLARYSMAAAFGFTLGEVYDCVIERWEREMAPGKIR